MPKQVPDWPNDDLLLAIAAEMNLSETVFLVGGDGSYDIRWFTPTREVDLIGHATLAAAFVVFTEIEPGRTSVQFRSAGEPLSVGREGELLAMDFPSLQSRSVTEGAAIAEALKTTPESVFTGKHYMAVYKSAKCIRTLSPDMAALARLDLPAVMVTAPAEEPGVDFVSRFFAPANGVPEDPVSGVAHLALLPYWARRLGKERMTGKQLSHRGGTIIGVDRGSRVTLIGKAVPVLKGRIYP